MSRNQSFYLVVALVVAATLSWAAWNKSRDHFPKLPQNAVAIGDYYLNCDGSNPDISLPCHVFDKSGALIAADPFWLRLVSFAEQSEKNPIQCPQASLEKAGPEVANCVRAAFEERRAFAAEYSREYPGGLIVGYGVAGDGNGHVAEFQYQSRSFPGVRPNPRISLLDGAHIRMSSCIEPVHWAVTDGLIQCSTPINEKRSRLVATQRPIETTLCAITEHPERFNNKLVQIKAHYDGNFEYSTLSSDGCPDQLWFEYAAGEPVEGHLVSVLGQASGGEIDEKGWWVRPIPVKLIKDKNFKNFQKLMRNRPEAKNKPGASEQRYQVTATLVGRIDAVSEEVHRFHQASHNLRADYLGFGQMGMFDAEFVMQSVKDDAVLSRREDR